MLPGHEFVLHATEWYALHGLLRQLTGLQVAPRGQLHAMPPPDQQLAAADKTPSCEMSFT